MRVKIWCTLIILSLVIIVISCDTVDKDPIINAEDYYGDGSYFISLARLSSPEIYGDYCGSPVLFEFRDLYYLTGMATSSIYNDGLFLNFQHNLTQNIIDEGWIIVTSYVWVGSPEDWPFGKKGPQGGWASIPGVSRKEIPSNSTNALHRIPLEKWMFDECFIVGVRLILDGSELQRQAPESLINHGDYLSYSWNEPFCLEECIDPGTQNVSYWENNPDVWTKGVTIGGIFYSEELALQIMKGITTEDDMSNVLFEELVSAKLNVDLGNTAYCIIDVIEAADAWMEENGPVGSGIQLDHPAYDTGSSLVSQLESYNNGLMCADPAN
jgi:hypothetical protein